MRADWLKTVFVWFDGDTELGRSVDVVVMGRAKGIYILIIKVNKLFSFFSSRCFLKEMENMYSVFPSYRNTREGLGELEKASRSPKLPLAFRFYNSIETRYMFSIS